MVSAIPGNGPVFLNLDEVLQIHQHQIEMFGGDLGIRDIGMLESAIAQPKQGFGGEFLHPDIASMAAAYVFHIAQNHPFIDGNKRTGIQSAIIFLEMNRISIDFPLEETYAVCMAVASGVSTKQEVTEFFRRLLDNY